MLKVDIFIPDGTTDISRTFHFGTPTSKQKEAYTRVLAGLLSLTKLKFPHSVDTTDVDILARSHLWAAGMDYMHGTGHGIGSFLGVHECQSQKLLLNSNSNKIICDSSYHHSLQWEA